VCGGDVKPTATLHAHDRLTSSAIRYAVHDCATCGLGLITPRPPRESIASLYEESYPSWRAQRGLEGLFAQAKAYVVARVPPYGRHRARRGGRMLDVGLGRGDLAHAFARSGWKTHGLDMSFAAVEVARSRGIDARQGTLDAPPWPPGSFDLLVLSHVLEHVTDPVDELRRARALVRSGGTVIVAVPGWDSWQRRVFQSCWAQTDLPRHLQHFTVTALNEAARAAGFSGARLRRCTSMVGLPISLQFAIAGRWPFGARWRKGFLAASAALYPVAWALGRLFGGDCVYMELRT
jgi:SAM-dependent methyltransferase